MNCEKSRGRDRSPEDTDFLAECLRCPGTCLVEGFPDPQVAQKLEVLPKKAQKWRKVGDHLFKDQTLLVFTSRKLPTERFILEWRWQTLQKYPGQYHRVRRPFVPSCDFFILKPKDVFAPSLLRMREHFGSPRVSWSYISLSPRWPSIIFEVLFIATVFVPLRIQLCEVKN